jgi:hypothetical protein
MIQSKTPTLARGGFGEADSGRPSKANSAPKPEGRQQVPQYAREALVALTDELARVIWILDYEQAERQYWSTRSEGAHD